MEQAAHIVEQARLHYGTSKLAYISNDLLFITTSKKTFSRIKW